MAQSNLEAYELSVQEGAPIECYRFSHAGRTYQYTSAANDVALVVEEEGKKRTELYFAEHIERGALKPGGMTGAVECAVTVSKDNAVAKLFQGPPPEEPVELALYRLHNADKTLIDALLRARIHRAKFQASECELGAVLENWLAKEVPGGTYQYYCNSVLFDACCGLKREDWQETILIDEVKGLDVYSTEFAKKPDGYYVGGRLYYQGAVRMLSEHEGNRVRLKYPFSKAPHNQVAVLPGCDHLFRTCALRFGNEKNFSGCPYVAPTDPEKNPTGRGVYWLDSLVVQRDTDGFVGTISL